jgi:hypothetical protein
VAPIDAFLRDVDRALVGELADRLVLHVIGSTALMLQVDYQRGTKDSDILEIAAFDPVTRRKLLEVAGPGTGLHVRHRLYLDIVANGVPFVPHTPRWHRAAALSHTLQRLDLEVLDVVDVVVSKLKPFRPQDREDIAAMVDRGFIEHASLVERFRATVDRFAYDARADELPRCVANLHRIERDLFGLPPTEIELPSWI